MERRDPLRMCVSCRAMAPKSSLLRIARLPSGELALDTKGRLGGRGAYICSDMACLQKARKSRALERVLKMTIEGSVFSELERKLQSVEAG